MPSESDMDAALQRLDSELKQVVRRVDATEADIHQISSDMRSMRERREVDHGLLVEIRSSIAEMKEHNKSSLANVHGRIDVVKEENTLNRGIEQGRREERARVFKIIGGFVAVIAIVGFLGRLASNEAEAAVLREEQEECHRTDCPRPR